MGFFDRFKKQNKNEVRTESKAQMQQIKENKIEYSCTEDGRLVVELIERKPKQGQFYDTTKLVFDSKIVNLEGQYLKNCMVSWYGQDDCVRLDSNGNDYGRRGQFKNVIADIDTDLIWNDEEYCLAVMKMLLNKNRVDEYLNRGLQDIPDFPCGKYVGGIKLRGGEYQKVFYRELGKASHNSPEMVSKRRRLKEQKRQSQARAIDDKKAQIARLQQELEEMNR